MDNIKLDPDAEARRQAQIALNLPKLETLTASEARNLLNSLSAKKKVQLPPLDS